MFVLILVWKKHWISTIILTISKQIVEVRNNLGEKTTNALFSKGLNIYTHIICNTFTEWPLKKSFSLVK